MSKVKYCYKYVKDLLIFEDECIEYLEKMALKGWRLVRVGATFFKFEKFPPQQLKYQMDNNQLSDEYLEFLNLSGYHFVDNFRELAIFYNEDIGAENLHTDDKTRLMILDDKYKSWRIILAGVGALFSYISADFYGVFSLLTRNTLGSFFLELPLFLGHYLMLIISLIFLIDAFIGLLVKWDIKRQQNNKSSLKQWIKLGFKIDNIIIIITLVLVGFAVINMIFYRPRALIYLIISFILYLIFAHFINKSIYRENNEVMRKVKVIMAVVVFFSINFIGRQFDFGNPSKTVAPFQQAKDVETSSDLSILLKTYTSFCYQGEETEFLETKYECFNNFIANEIFKELVCEVERDSRRPSQEEIDAIVEKTGEWSTNDIGYLDYNQALNKFERLENKYVSECWYLNDEYIAIQGNQVLLVKLKNDVKIDDVLRYYYEKG